MKPLRLPGSISPHSVCHVALRYLGLISWLRSPPQGNRCVSAWVLFTGFTRSGLLSQGDLRFSQVPREPHYAFALLSDPGRTSAPRLFAALRYCPRELHDEGSSDKYPFETQSHGFGIHCLRFVPPFLTTTQDSLPGVANLFRVGLATH